MDIRRTASVARVLWYGSLTLGALLGAGGGAWLAVRYTTPRD